MTLDGAAAPVVGRVMRGLVDDLDFDAVGGLTLGAGPVALAMVHAAAAAGGRLDAFVVRKQAKSHGLQRQIEGTAVEGRKVLLVEDTSTTGGSVLTAAEAVADAGGHIVGVAVIVDRETGARERIEDAGYPYRAAVTTTDLGPPDRPNSETGRSPRPVGGQAIGLWLVSGLFGFGVAHGLRLFDPCCADAPARILRPWGSGTRTR